MSSPKQIHLTELFFYPHRLNILYWYVLNLFEFIWISLISSEIPWITLDTFWMFIFLMFIFLIPNIFTSKAYSLSKSSSNAFSRKKYKFLVSWFHFFDNWWRKKNRICLFNFVHHFTFIVSMALFLLFFLNFFLDGDFLLPSSSFVHLSIKPLQLY